MSTDQALAIAPGAALAATHSDGFDPVPELWGFGGMHGGLALALLTQVMSKHAGGQALRSVTGRFHRPLRERFEISAAETSNGRRSATWRARAVAGNRLHLEANAVFAASPGVIAPVAPVVPPAPPPGQCEPFDVPLDFVPFARHTEVRPVGDARPFTGGDEPELTAWVRLTEDDLPPDVARFVVLLDSLAPSYGAVLTAPTLIPTVELTVHPADALALATSPWILLRARTVAATADGWLDERVDAWSPAGNYLGGGQQLRLVRG